MSFKVSMKNKTVELVDLIKYSKGVRVLYVEDDANLREDIRGVFKIFFHDIDIATDGVDGLNHFIKNKYDLIITGINMPNMNGVEMITKIREISKHITILITSSNADNFINLIRLGIDGYILKPVEVQQFTDIIQKVIEKLQTKDELYNYKISLEQQVKDKTKELELLNKNLEKKVKEEIAKNKQKEKLLAQQSKMAAMGEMLENIAHQWRQPLSVISIASTGMQLHKELGISDEKAEINSLNSINSSAQFLSDTIDDFRNFFKEDKKKSTFNLKKVYINSFNILSAKFENKNIKIIQDINGVEIYGFAGEMTQIIINILNNAIDVLLSQEIKKMYVFINIYRDDSNAILEIKDNGGGVPEDIISRIFEPYFTTKHQTQGTGIGLYMCEEMITKHMNGTIEVQNIKYEYNNIYYKGACFKITLPLLA